MFLTNEQKAIIEEVKKGTKQIKINAFAGTGKTTVLVEIAKANTDKKILYLAFNRSIANEAKKKFPKNTHIYTTHALAYKYTVVPNEYKIGSLKAIKIMEEYSIEYKEALYVLNIFEYFCNSGHLFWNKLKTTDEKYKKIAGEIFIDMLKGKRDITHSFYVKQFHLLLNKNIIDFPQYDIILLDEAQDTNNVTLAIFNTLPGKQKIMVGDKHQQIYSFRGSKNALLKLKGKTFYLTNSFRFNQTIAGKANKILYLFKGETQKIKGLNINTDIKTKAYISRTNSALIEIINDLTQKRIFFKTIRKPYEIFGYALNIYKLHLNKDIDKEYEYLNVFKKKKIDENIKMLTFIEQEAENADDVELLSAVRIVKKFGGKLFELYKKANENYFSKQKSAVFLTTAHTSKGLEFDEIELLSDFRLEKRIAKWFKKKNIIVPKNQYLQVLRSNINKITDSIVDEINLYYVALTRGKIKVNDQNFIGKITNEESINFIIKEEIKK